MCIRDRRDIEAARRDLVRICAEVREELEPDELVLRAAQPLSLIHISEPTRPY